MSTRTTCLHISYPNCEVFFEIDDANAVTRTVTVVEGQAPRSDSIAIRTHRGGASAEALLGQQRPCLWGHTFPSPDQYDAFWSQRGAKWEHIEPGRFAKLFERANPNISFQEP